MKTGTIIKLDAGGVRRAGREICRGSAAIKGVEDGMVKALGTQALSASIAARFSVTDHERLGRGLAAPSCSDKAAAGCGLLFRDRHLASAALRCGTFGTAATSPCSRRPAHAFAPRTVAPPQPPALSALSPARQLFLFGGRQDFPQRPTVNPPPLPNSALPAYAGRHAAPAALPACIPSRADQTS